MIIPHAFVHGDFFMQIKEEINMSANVETMFYTRTVPWHGLGTKVEEAPNSKEALIYAGLDWKVIQESITTVTGTEIRGFKANLRETDKRVLGIVSDRYQIVQNEEAFAFTDSLLGEGVTYETAGSLADGKIVWILAKMPQKYIISGDCIDPYIVFSNTHDGSGAIRIAMTPVRVVCQNTLNLALKSAKRSWSAKHTGNVMNRLDEARQTLQLADTYMKQLGKSVDELNRKRLSDTKAIQLMKTLYPVTEDMTKTQKKNSEKQLEQLKMCYFDAPDLKDVGKNAYRFINAVSDMAYHGEPLRKTPNYKENLFKRTMDGNPIVDKTYQMLQAIA